MPGRLYLLKRRGGAILHQPDECIDCGACEPECPVNAIFAEDEVPDDQQRFTQINTDFFNADGGGLAPGMGDKPVLGPPFLGALVFVSRAVLEHSDRTVEWTKWTEGTL
jgi:ferredoxin